jgi:hypothetical protein
MHVFITRAISYWLHGETHVRRHSLDKLRLEEYGWLYPASRDVHPLGEPGAPSPRKKVSTPYIRCDFFARKAWEQDGSNAGYTG